MKGLFAALTRQGALAGTVLCLGVTAALGQTPNANVSGGFTFPNYDDQDRLKSLLRGEAVEFVSGQQMRIGQLYLETYDSEGQTNLIVEAPDCRFNRATQLASSTNQLVVRAPDGRFFIEGRGFQWNMADSSLIISNAVHTTLQDPKLLEDSAPKPESDSGAQREVFSDRFRFDAGSGEAVYEGNVRALAPDRMNLTCGRVSAQLPVSGGRLEQIRAEENVVIEFVDPTAGRTRATGDLAVYTISAEGREQVELTGDPAWEAGSYSGHARRLILSALGEDFEFKARGAAFVKIPRPNEEEKSSTSGEADAPSSGNEPASSDKPASYIELNAEQYDFRPGEVVFRKRVRVQDPRWNLECNRLTARMKPGETDIEELVAEDEVAFHYRDGGNESHAWGERMKYTVANGIIELHGEPRWRTQKYEGRGDTLMIDRKADEFRAQGNASLKLFGQSVQQLGTLLPQPGAGNNEPIAPTETEGQASSSGETGETVEAAEAANGVDESKHPSPPLIVYSDAYQYAGGQLEFNGRVRVEHPRWYLNCSRLVLHLLPEANRIRQVVAKQGVRFGEIPAATGQADGSPWSIECQTVTVEMTDNGQRVQRIVAEKEVVYEQGSRRATGAKATFDVDTGDVELTGNQVFENEEIVLTEASVLIWNRHHQGLAALGSYNINGKLTEEDLSSESPEEP